jgi:hypothetical protein
MTTHTDRPAASHDRAAVPMAVLLWVMVVVALAYGVSQTLTKVVALFG